MRRSTLATALVAVFISYLGTPAEVQAGGYDETDLVADVKPLIDKNRIVHNPFLVDPNLKNPWGIAESSASPFWISDNNAGVSTLYRVPGANNTPVAINQPLAVVNIPSPGDPLGNKGTPTGAVFNLKGGSGGAFQISNGVTSGAAVFLFATEDGTIVGWNPTVQPSGAPSGTSHGIITPVDNSKAGAVYKGLAIFADPNSNAAFLYAANFSDMVEMYDRNFTLVTKFTDPNLPAAFTPFNVAVIGGKLFVTFAIRRPHTGNPVPGGGSGIVSVFNLDGTFIQRFAEHGQLKAPWGMALAPVGFGALGGALWIGNFGDGQINAFDFQTGAFIDKVRDRDGKPIVIDGLWALQVGNGGAGGLANTLYFTAGPNDEKDGLFGSLTPH
jgi:uncharacterized protein (TIGR03118 family)